MTTEDWTAPRALVAGLRADLAGTVSAAAERIQTELVEFSILPTADVEATVAESMELLLDALAARRVPSAAEADKAAGSTTGVGVRQAMPLETVLHRYRLTMGALWRAVAARAAELELPAPALLEVAQLMWDGADALMLRAAQMHRLTESELERHSEEERRSFLRALLLGSITPQDLRSRSREFGLSTEREYFPFRARTGMGLTVHRLEAEILATATIEHAGVACLLEGTLLGVLPTLPSIDGLNGVVGVGPAATLEAAKSSFQHATRAMETADAFGLTGVYRVEDLPLRALVASEPHLGDALVATYLGPLDGLGQFGPAVQETLREFFRRGMRVEETARALDVHPNTLRHRLRRFEEVTGSDLGDTEQLFRVWWALERRSLLQRHDGDVEIAGG